jgi:hypothetical protein
LPPSATRDSVPPHGISRATPPQPGQRVAPQRSPEETFRSQSLPSSHIPPVRTREESMRMLQQRNMIMGEHLQREQRAEAHRPPQQRLVPGIAPLQQLPRTSELHRPEPPLAREAPASVHKQASTHPTVTRQE